MSVVPGIFVNTQNNLVSGGSPPAREIGIIGHSSDPQSLLVDKFFTGSVDGEVFKFGTFGDAVALLADTDGSIDGLGWNDGDVDDGGATPAITPFDSKDNLIRAIELIYTGGSPIVHACVLDGVVAPLTGTDSLPAGAQRALDKLLLQENIGYVLLANLDPLAAGVTHAHTASDPAKVYNSPRFYTTGMDLFKAWDGVTTVGAGEPLDATNDLSTWSGIKSDKGLALAYLGNHDFNFSVVPSEDTVQIGGQLAAAYLAGRLSGLLPNAPLTFLPNALGKNVFVNRADVTVPKNSVDYIFDPQLEMPESLGAGWISTRFVNNEHVLSKGITFTSVPAWDLYPHRSVTNFIHKSLVQNLRAFLGELQTSANIMGAQALTEAILADARARLFISSFQTPEVRPNELTVDAIDVSVTFVTTKPINQININMTVS
jgi:hypothetical protein